MEHTSSRGAGLVSLSSFLFEKAGIFGFSITALSLCSIEEISNMEGLSFAFS